MSSLAKKSFMPDFFVIHLPRANRGYGNTAKMVAATAIIQMISNCIVVMYDLHKIESLIFVR